MMGNLFGFYYYRCKRSISGIFPIALHIHPRLGSSVFCAAPLSSHLNGSQPCHPYPGCEVGYTRTCNSVRAYGYADASTFICLNYRHL